jgi:hypothetical protein
MDAYWAQPPAPTGWSRWRYDPDKVADWLDSRE